jgi:hypothetical protein
MPSKTYDVISGSAPTNPSAARSIFTNSGLIASINDVSHS